VTDLAIAYAPQYASRSVTLEYLGADTKISVAYLATSIDQFTLIKVYKYNFLLWSFSEGEGSGDIVL